MGKLLNFLFIAIVLLATACVPQTANKGRSAKVSQGSTSGDDSGAPSNNNGSTDPNFTSGSVSWYNGNFINGTLQISDSFGSVIYLRGQPIDTFLKTEVSNGNSNAVYCLVINFNEPKSKDQYRVRAVPLSFNNFQTGQLEYTLRLDTNQSSAECDGDVNSFFGTTIKRLDANTNLDKFYLSTIGLSTNARGYYSFSSGSYSNFSSANGLPSNSIFDVWADGGLGSNVLVATSSGLGISTDNGTSFVSKSTNDGLVSNSISSVYADSTFNDFVIGTDNGISISNNGGLTFTSRTTANGLNNNTVNDVWTDGSNIFVANNGGLNYSGNFATTPFLNISTDATNHLYYHEDGLNSQVIAATNNGVKVYTTSGVTASLITTANGLPTNNINATFYDGSDYYIATTSGLVIFDSGTFTVTETITTAQGLNTNNVLGVVKIGTLIYAATTSKVFYRTASSTGSNFVELPPSTHTLSLNQVCPSCDDVTSFKTRLYQVDSLTDNISETTAIPALDEALSGVNLKINIDSPTEFSGSSCDNSTCQAQGFDCCLEGQCVRDAAERPEASANAVASTEFNTYYQQALADVASDPLNFINYPDVYYVCSQQPPQPGATPTPFPDAQATADARFEEEKNEFFCLDNVKQNPGDYSMCLDQNGDLISNYDDWDLIRKRVWDRCGCEADPFEEPFCPDYGLKVVKDQNDVITEVLCDIPQPLLGPTPFQNLDFQVSARSVPHRFFRSDDGSAVDDITPLAIATPGVTQEGEEFSYLDQSGKTEPQNGLYNMNSVLGSMKVNLSGARPARALAVEFGQEYVIMAKSGYHTPCPQCGKDYWFDAFMAHPPSQNGMGLQATGYTNRRDVFDTNTTLGNFEDTLFGRACWLPPTMIPFTHMPQSDVQEQRMNRLMTQAALYINGYQRDWFGFNKGALIGSFDGVKWFAIGTGRKVVASSNRLYLAINAPFGDLAENTDLSVSIVIDLGGNEVASLDYDPSLSLTDPNQNQAATCQKYHQCDTDLDCVTNLGWEYVCADTGFYRTSLPEFDVEADEKSNGSINKASFSEIVFGNLPPAGGGKRCVYRGRGAICDRTSLTLPEAKFGLKKLFTCAPNFYCAELSETEFNKELVREPNVVQSFLYGREADVLGRPLTYIGAGDKLETQIQTNLEFNASATVYGSDNFEADLGICIPGKEIDIANPDWNDQHRNKDNTERTDYINQIASCDSTEGDTPTQSRVQSCPAFVLDSDEDEFGNYAHYYLSNPFDIVSTNSKITNMGNVQIETYKRQNMCGNQAYSHTTGVNAFSFIEADPLGTISSLVQPTLVKDACFRKAGSPCFTDLECAPNRMHSEQAILYAIEQFGGTESEYQFWTEDLVCGQGDEPPLFGDPDYEDYSLAENRCCREVGKDFTMYSQFIADVSGGVGFMDTAADLALASDLMNYFGLDSNTQNPVVDNFPSDNGTGEPGYRDVAGPFREYSRYSIVDMISGDSNSTNLQAKAPLVYAADDKNTTGYQWLSFKSAGEKNCCGGGWIRKFADGTNDWINFKRFDFDFENFKCLNYVGPLGSGNKPGNVQDVNWNRDSDKLCLDPAGYGCIQLGNVRATSFELQPPAKFHNLTAGELFSLFTGTSINDNGELFEGNNYNHVNNESSTYIDMTPDDGLCDGNVPSKQTVHPFAPFQPQALYNTNCNSGAANCIADPLDGGLNGCLGTPNDPPALTLNLPGYIGGLSNITAVMVKFFDVDGNPLNSTCSGDYQDRCWTYSWEVLTPNDFDISGDYPGCTDGADYDDLSAFADFFDDEGDGDGNYTCNDGNDNSGGCTYNASAKAWAWCVHKDSQERDVIKFGVNEHFLFPNNNTSPQVLWQFASFRIEFNIPGTDEYDSPDPVRDGQGMLPGNDLYYLTKLGRLELLGIPQIYQEPLWCNTNFDKLVPNLYDASLYNAATDDDRAQMLVDPNNLVFDYSRTRHGTLRDLETLYDEAYTGIDQSKTEIGNGLWMHGNAIDHDPIFSAHEFKCCRQLGQTATTPANCCSNYADLNNNGEFECKLPKGTNLNVYFNRFVSNEGQGEEQPGGGLEDEDFIPETGEPKLDPDVYAKIIALGEEYCDGGNVTRGGLYGFYQGSPNNGFTVSAGATNHPDGELRYSILDESTDFDGDNTSGSPFFRPGLHWDHHIYCSPDSN